MKLVKKIESSCVGFVFHIEKFGNACCKELIKINIVRNRFLFLYHVSYSYFLKRIFVAAKKFKLWGQMNSFEELVLQESYDLCSSPKVLLYTSSLSSTFPTNEVTTNHNMSSCNHFLESQYKFILQMKHLFIF